MHKFSDELTSIFDKAVSEAARLRHPSVGTEHLLLGIFMSPMCTAYRAISGLGADVQDLDAGLRKMIGLSASRPLKLDYSEHATVVIDLAKGQALEQGSQEVDSFHLLTSILLRGSGAGYQILTKNGFFTEKLDSKQVLRRVVNESINSTVSDILSKVSTDLTKLALDGMVDPLIGREEEVERLVQILSRRKKNNPVLIGDPGVGKTAIVEGIAQRIINGDVSPILKEKRVLAIEMSSLVANTKYRGEFEERLSKIISEVIEKNDIILFIDEIHTIVGAGGAEGGMDAANILKPALARGIVQCIGATTVEEYRKYIERDAALERRFQPIFVEEPTVEETKRILGGIRHKYEEHHRVVITNEAIHSAAHLSSKYISDRFLPDKAIDLVDESCARAVLQSYMDPKILVTAKHVAAVTSAWTGIPIDYLTSGNKDTLSDIESRLSQHIVGHADAIRSITESMKRSLAGIRSHRVPMGSFLLAGPPGVGKTHFAIVIAKEIFGNERALIRIDLSEYTDALSVSRLIGAAPGLIGYDDGGHLTERVRRKPYSVILFDEMEKAHPGVLNILLQILDEGSISDSKGRSIDFRNCLIILTTNTGNKSTLKSIGFNNQLGSDENRRVALAELNKEYSSELLSRIGEIIVLQPLSMDEVFIITKMLVDDLLVRLGDFGVVCRVSDTVIMRLAKDGYRPEHGVRPIRRLVETLIEGKLSQFILGGEIEKERSIFVDEHDGEIVIQPITAIHADMLDK